MNNLDLLIPQQAAKPDSWLWATITRSTPLRIRLDGDDVSLDLTPEYLFPGEPPLGARVWVQVNGRRVIVHGPTRGVDYGPEISAAEARAMLHAETEIAVAMESIPGDIEAAEAAAKAHAEQVLATEVAAIEAAIAAGDQIAQDMAAEALAAEAARIEADLAVTNENVLDLAIEVETLKQDTDDSIGEVSGLVAIINGATRGHHGIY